MSDKYTLLIFKKEPQYKDICLMYIPYDYISDKYSLIDIDEEYLCVLKLSHDIKRAQYLDIYFNSQMYCYVGESTNIYTLT